MATASTAAKVRLVKHPDSCTVELSDWLKAWGNALVRAGEEADVERRVRQIEGRERGRAWVAEARQRRAAGASWGALAGEFKEPIPVLKRLLGSE